MLKTYDWNSSARKLQRRYRAQKKNKIAQNDNQQPQGLEQALSITKAGSFEHNKDRKQQA